MALTDQQYINKEARYDAGVTAGGALNAASTVVSGLGLTADEAGAFTLELAEMFCEWLHSKKDGAAPSPFVAAGVTATPTTAAPTDSAPATPEEAVATVVEQLDAEVVKRDCPKCGGDMWDNREKKATGGMSAKAPDWSCKDRACGGALGWPEKGGRKRSAPSDRAKAAASQV